MKKLKRPMLIVSAIILLWLAIGITDFIRVCALSEKPIFTVTTKQYGHGGITYREYMGLGCSFVITYNSYVDETEYISYLFGIEIDNNFTNSSWQNDLAQPYVQKYK